MSNTLNAIRKKSMAGVSGGVSSEVSFGDAVEHFELLQVSAPGFGAVFDDAQSIRPRVKHANRAHWRR